MRLLDWFIGATPTEVQDYRYLGPEPAGQYDFAQPRLRQTDEWGRETINSIRRIHAMVSNDGPVIKPEDKFLYVELTPIEMGAARAVRITPIEAAKIKLKAKERHLSFHDLLDLSHPRLDEIRTALRALTYGEMIELSKQLSKHLPKEVREIVDLPTMLHQWAIEVAEDEPRS